jgi:uncharacterized membrane protein
MAALTQLNDLRKTLNNLTDIIDLDDLSGLTDKLGSALTERKKVLGLPVGSKQTDWSKLATYGVAAAGALAGSRLLGRGHDGAQAGPLSGLFDEESTEKGKDMADEDKGLIEKGKDALGTVTDLGDKLDDVQEATSKASSPIGKVIAAVKAISGGGGPTKKARLIIQEQIDIAVPRRIVYDQWTQFEDMAERSRAVKKVDQEDDEHTSWQAKMLFSTRNFDAEIVQQVPDRRIVWESSGDVDHRGVVSFHELAEDLTRVQVEMEYHPTGFVEKFGNLFLTVRHRVRKDLRLFRHHLELEAQATGAWRGQIGDDIEVPEDDADDAETAGSSDDTAEEAEVSAGSEGTEGSDAKAKVADAFNATDTDGDPAPDQDSEQDG